MLRDELAGQDPSENERTLMACLRSGVAMDLADTTFIHLRNRHADKADQPAAN